MGDVESVVFLVAQALLVVVLLVLVLRPQWVTPGGTHDDAWRLRRLERGLDRALERLGVDEREALGDALPADARMALDAGNRIEAIKRYREAMGVDLREAKRAVDRADPLPMLEREVAALLAHLGVEVDNRPLDDVRQLLADGRKIEAIRRYRELTGAGLKAAKDAVEQMQRGG